VTETPGAPQIAGLTRRPRRTEHVWIRRADGSYKCTVCGGVARQPTRWDLAEYYEELTDAERALAHSGGGGPG
jgi:Tfp pilus assembly protein FimV